ncbi:MAG: PorV/PorQ family protein [Elusimicrobia bacterium]|nr:PorV/PorQ family protein [Elusimicrobiota bacterium]
MHNFERILFLSGIMLVAAGPLAAETGSGGLPGYYLDEGGGARPLAMGGAFTAVADDASAIYWNAAGLGRLKRKEFQFTHIQLFESTRYDFLNYAHPFSRLVLGLGAGQLYSGGIAKTDQLNNPIGTFADRYNTVFAGGGMEILPDTVYFGFAAKRISRDMDDFNGTGYGLDAGLLAKLSEDENEYPFGFSAGVNIQNLVGPKIKREILTDEFPLNAKAGVAFTFFDQSLLIAGDIEKKTGGTYQPHAGIEYSLTRSVAFRAGYDKPNPTFGFGVKIGDCRLDYALLSSDEKELGLSHRFSAGVKFGRNIDLNARVNQALREGEAYLKDKQWRKAEESFQKALELDGNSRAAKESLIRVYLAWADGLATGEKPDRRDALNICRKALKFDPGNTGVRKKIAELNMVGVLNFELVNFSADDSKLDGVLAELLSSALVDSGEFSVVERMKLTRVVEESRLGASGVIRQEDVPQIGRLLGVNEVVLGSIARIESGAYLISIRFVDVESGQVVRAKTRQFPSLVEMRSEIYGIVDELKQELYSRPGRSLLPAATGASSPPAGAAPQITQAAPVQVSSDTVAAPVVPSAEVKLSTPTAVPGPAPAPQADGTKPADAAPPVETIPQPPLPEPSDEGGKKPAPDGLLDIKLPE